MDKGAKGEMKEEMEWGGSEGEKGAVGRQTVEEDC